MPDKQKKFVHFYLTELLNHVKSMNEHRLPPIEYNIVKRLVQFIVASGDVLAGLEKLGKVPALRPFCTFLEKNLQKTSDPGFGMSVLMSALESDSERISQILQQALATRALQEKLEAELHPIGVDIELTHLYDLYQKKDGAKPVVPSKTAPTGQSEARTPADSFAHVGDVAGFFTRRSRKSSEVPTSSNKEELSALGLTSAAMEDTEAAEVAREQPGAFSDAETFTVELRRRLQLVRSQIAGLADNLQNADTLGEAADGFGELKKLTKVYGFGDLHFLIERFEKRFNDIADHTDEKDLSVSERTIDVCRQLLNAVERTDYVDFASAKGDLVRKIRQLLADFESSLVVRSRVSKVNDEALSAEDLGTLDEPQSEGRELHLDGSRVSAEDYQIFKDEVYTYFDSLDSALLDLRKDRGNLAALRILQLALKGLQTASRVLKLGLFLDICGVAWNGINDVVRRRGVLSEAAHRHLVSLRSILRLLTEGQSISESSYDELKRALETLAEIPAETPKESVIETTRGVPVSLQEEPEEIGWIDDVQGVIDTFKDTAPSLTNHPEETRDTKKPELVTTKEVVAPMLDEDLVDLGANLREIAGRQLRTKPRTIESVVGEAPSSSGLLDLMASDNLATDLSSVKLETFIDRISADPEDIPETKGRRVPKKHKKTKESTGDASSTPPESIDSTSEHEVMSGILLQESHFSNVDAEILEIFIQESEGFFRTFERALEKLAANTKDESAIKEFERTGHSLKSSSRMLGFERISGLAGALELISERYFEKEIEFTTDILTLFKDIVAALDGLFKRSKVDIRSVLGRLIELEKKLGAPNIFTRNIPDAIEFEKQLKQEAESKAAAEQATIPETSGANYFNVLGVDEEIVQIFREESASYFRMITHTLDALTADRKKTATVRDIEKAAHSLRSSAKMLGFVKISDLMRPVESLAERINKGRLIVSDKVLESLVGVVGVLETLLRGQDVDVSAEIARVNAVLESTAEEESAELAGEKADALKTMQAQIDAPAEEHAKVQSSPAKKGKRIVKKKQIEIPDFQINNEPIFKRLHVEEALLDEMAQMTTTSRGA